jgi:hypothetical protein
MELRHFFLLVALLAIGTIAIPSVYSAFAADHSFYDTGGKSCPSCHSDIKRELDSSAIHSTFTCENCHVNTNLQSSTSHGNVIIPKCIDCHSDVNQPLTKDSHQPFMLGANSSNLKNGDDEACISCHSNTNKAINFARPSFVEWNVKNVDGSWLIENLTLGANKNIKTSTNLGNSGIHSISLDNGCVNCHNDIRNAVIQGGHSNERWKMKHDYSGYSDMNTYCRSCHVPSTGNIFGTKPYPAVPFNSVVHASMTVTCIDCHARTDLIANVNGGMKLAPYNDYAMGNIAVSMSEQPYNVQSYLCIACKNTGNPNPVNGTLHFKMLTEPDTTISLTIIPIPTPVPTPNATATPTPVVTPTPTPNATATPAPVVTPTPTPNATATPTPVVTPTPTPNATATPVVTPTPTPVVTPTPTPNATATPVVTPTPTPVVTPTPSPNATATPTPVVTPTPTPVVTPTPTPVVTDAPVTPTPSPVVTPTPTPVVTDAPVVTPTPAPVATDAPVTPTPSPVVTDAPVVAPAVKVTPVATPNVTKTI